MVLSAFDCVKRLHDEELHDDLVLLVGVHFSVKIREIEMSIVKRDICRLKMRFDTSGIGTHARVSCPCSVFQYAKVIP